LNPDCNISSEDEEGIDVVTEICGVVISGENNVKDGEGFRR
jgi:hypothetical protein